MIKRMAAVAVKEVGCVKKLVLDRARAVPTTLAREQVLVRNEFAGLNMHDTYTRSGLYPLPIGDAGFVVGCEGAGVVAAVGESVSTGVKVGDRVAYLQEGVHGSYAEYTPVNANRLMPVPDELPLELACAVAVQGMTAHYLVNDSFKLEEGHWCVITAVAGGTGQLLLQLAKRAGANVVGICSTEEKAKIARELGADYVLTTADRDQDCSSWMSDSIRDCIRSHDKIPENCDGHGGNSSSAGEKSTIGVETAAASYNEWFQPAYRCFLASNPGASQGHAFKMVKEQWETAPENPKYHVLTHAENSTPTGAGAAAALQASLAGVSLYGASIDDGAHVVYDSVGLATYEASLDCLRPRGTAVFYGNASGAPPPIAPLALAAKGSLAMTRPKLHDFLLTRKELLERSGAVFAMALSNGDAAFRGNGGVNNMPPLKINVQEVLPFTEEGVRHGHSMIEGRRTVGKVLFKI